MDGLMVVSISRIDFCIVIALELVDTAIALFCVELKEIAGRFGGSGIRGCSDDYCLLFMM